MGGDVAGGARVGVVLPDAADPLALLEDGDVLVALALQHRRGADAAEAAADDRDGRPARSYAEALHAEVAEGLVALAHGLLEARLGGAADEAVALLGVAGDAVEEGAEQLGLVQALRVEATG